MFGKAHTLFRPLGEADSLIIRVADGCPATNIMKDWGWKNNFQPLNK